MTEHNPRLRYPDHRAECNWNTFPDFDEDGDAVEAWCNADKDTLGNIRTMPRGHERPVPVPMIWCLCGDGFPTVESMHEHIHMVHVGTDHDFT